MLEKTLMVATLGTALAAGTLSTTASAQGDPFLGALVGGGIGAAIGHSVNGHNGAWVGGAVGALAGASIAANSGYYGGFTGHRGTSRRRPRITLRHPTITARRRSTSRRRWSCIGRARSSTRARITTRRVTRRRVTVTAIAAPMVTRTRTRTRDTALSLSSTHVQPRHPAGLSFLCERSSRATADADPRSATLWGSHASEHCAPIRHRAASSRRSACRRPTTLIDGSR